MFLNRYWHICYHACGSVRFRRNKSFLLAHWLDTEPEVPEGKWFKRFAGFLVCGQGELIKTFLLPGQLPDGQEIH